MTTTDHEFEEFARARAPQLYRSAWLLCGDRQRAEDLVQETLAKVYVRWRRPFASPIDNPAAYAQTTLTRTYLSLWRRRSHHELTFAEPPEQTAHPGDVGADPSEVSDTRLELVRALAELAPPDRAVLVLRYLEDLSVEDVSHRMGVSPGAVRSRSLRALDRIRPLLDHSLSPTPQNRTHR